MALTNDGNKMWLEEEDRSIRESPDLMHSVDDFEKVHEPLKFPPIDKAKFNNWKTLLRESKLKSQLVTLLGKTFIFAETRELFRETIAELLIPMEYAAGQTVFSHGEEGTWLGILVSGRMQRRLETQTSVVFLGDLGPGGVIGDLGMFGISPFRSVTVVARTHCEILVLSQRNFEQAVKNAGGPTSLNLVRDAGKMQDLMADRESFKALPCFKNMDENFVMTLRDNSEPRLCYNNQVLMKEGHYGNEMYILGAGTVRIEMRGKFTAELPSGIVLGELAVLGSDKRRSATVTCTSFSFVRVLHADVFHAIVERFPTAKRIFEHAYVARLASHDVHSAKEELSSYHKDFGSATPRTRAQVQELLGETVAGTPRKSKFALPSIGTRTPSPLNKEGDPLASSRSSFLGSSENRRSYA